MTRRLALGLAAAAVLAALLFARPQPTPGPPMRDFEAYYAAGQTWNAGRDPYSSAIWDAERSLTGGSHRYEPLPFVGPPAVLPVFGILARVPFAAANTLWRALLVLCAAALALCTFRIAGIAIRPRTFVTIAVFALGFGPLTSAFALGQLALVAYTCAAASVLWAPISVLAWVQPNVALPLIAYVRDRKRAWVLAAGALVFAAACVWVAGLSAIPHYAALLRAHEAAERFSAIQFTPASIAYGAGLSPTVSDSIGTVCAVAAVFAWILMMVRRHDAIARFCGTSMLLPFAVPFFHEHDFIVAFVPAVYLTKICRPALWPLAAAAALLCATDWLGLAQRPDGEIQTLLLVAAAATALFLLREDLRWTAALWPLAVVVLIAAVAPIAGAHKLPVWPEAMSSLPVQLARENIATIWHVEQAAAGLFLRDGMWSALRALTLLGCAILIGLSFVRSSYSTER